MPITLIRNTKDNAMHGSDNDRYTGCRMKMQGGSWYTREGELKDITDLTCDRCKEVFATKMIRESNKEELRIAKEEKKRYQRAKKQGIVREATYEEYLMNREAEASAKRDSRNDEATSNSLHQLKDAIPAEQPSFNSYNPAVNNTQSQFNPYTNQTPISAPQAPFDPYAQPVVSAPQAPFDPYAQPVAAPQGPFDPYAQQTPVVSAPQGPFDPYSMTSQPQMFNPYAQTPAQETAPQNGSLQFESIQPAQPAAAPVDDGPAPSYQEYTGAASLSSAAETSAPAAAAADDDFLSQFMFKPAASPVAEEPAPAVTADSIVNATDDILSQFNIGSQIADTAPAAPSPVSAPSPAPAAKADASSFFSDSIPVIGAEYAGASSVNSAVTEFGSLNIVEAPKDEFVVPDVPSFQQPANSFTNGYTASQNSVSLSELVSPDTSVLPQAHPDAFAAASEGFGSSDDFMSGFGDIPAVPSVSSFDTVQSAPSMGGFDSVPVQPAQSMSGFDTVSPVQPAPSMTGFDTVSPVQPAPSMTGFDTVSPVQSAPSFTGFDTVAPAQSAPSFKGFDTVAPVQPAAPSVNSFNEVPPVQQFNPYAMPQNNYAQPASYQQPAAIPNAAPAQQGGFQMPQGFGTPAPKPVQPQKPAAKPVQPAPVFSSQNGGTADSIEEALRQLGADVSGMGGNNDNQMPEKEEITPDFVAYVPSSSKVLHSSAPSQSALASVPKRPISSREAKQLAKIDAKFKKDLISRGFNPNEIKNGRRGK